MNGRVTPELNNFTSSVPDYLFCPTKNLAQCKEVSALLVRDIVNRSGIRPPINLPDHSVLLGVFETSEFITLGMGDTVNIAHLAADLPQIKRILKRLMNVFSLMKEFKMKLQMVLQE